MKIRFRCMERRHQPKDEGGYKGETEGEYEDAGFKSYPLESRDVAGTQCNQKIKTAPCQQETGNAAYDRENEAFQ
jgi:hypothetical protein